MDLKNSSVLKFFKRSIDKVSLALVTVLGHGVIRTDGLNWLCCVIGTCWVNSSLRRRNNLLTREHPKLVCIAIAIKIKMAYLLSYFNS